MRLEGKVAMVTGGARGQGAAEARMFAREGAKVVIADVLDPDGMAVAAEINELGGDATYVHLDVSSEADWQQAIEATVSAYGKLDVLVNNAAIWRGGHVLETSVEQWDIVLDINAKGVFLGTKLAIPEMRKAGGGSINQHILHRRSGGQSHQQCLQRVQGSCPAVHQVHRGTVSGPRIFAPTPSTRGLSTPTWATRSGPTPKAARRSLSAPFSSASARPTTSPTAHCSWPPRSRRS